MGDTLQYASDNTNGDFLIYYYNQTYTYYIFSQSDEYYIDGKIVFDKLPNNLDEFKNILIEESYDYIYVRITDRILENKFKELFENGLIEDNTLYEVIKENDNIMFSRVKWYWK